MVHEFSPALWSALLLSVLTAGLVSWVLASRVRLAGVERARGRFARFPYTLAFAAVTLIGLPRPRVPRLGPLRAFLTAWFFFALVMTTAYIASLRSLMEDPWARGEIRTLQGILDAGLDVVMHPNLYDSLQEVAEEMGNATLLELARRADFEVHDDMQRGSIHLHSTYLKCCIDLLL